MKITVDSNILIRLATKDDMNQFGLAADLLEEASVIAVTTESLCEFCWVLGAAYKFSKENICKSIRTLIESSGVMTDILAVEAGLDMLERGGDFADGVIAYKGEVLGGETFVSFDKGAIRFLNNRGVKSCLLNEKTIPSLMGREGL